MLESPASRAKMNVSLAGSKAGQSAGVQHDMLPPAGSTSRTCRMYGATIGGERHVFPDLVTPLAKASPPRSGDGLAGIAA